MSLVQQLRDTAKMGVSDEDCLMLDAADWIGKLEAALELIHKTDTLSKREMQLEAQIALGKWEEVQR
jgi:hypothetical protein